MILLAQGLIQRFGRDLSFGAGELQSLKFAEIPMAGNKLMSRGPIRSLTAAALTGAIARITVQQHFEMSCCGLGALGVPRAVEAGSLQDGEWMIIRYRRMFTGF